jgi:hypothetical protein
MLSSYIFTFSHLMINQPSTGKGGIPGSRSNMEPGIEKVTAVVLTAVLAGVVLLL